MKTEELIKVKKYIEHVIGTIKHDGHLGRIQTDWIFPDLEKALEAIEGGICFLDTDELSVEKLQEHLLPYKKEMVQKIIDEKIQLVTADEFVKLHKESLTAIRENDKLKEQLNTAKKALTEISSTRQEVWRGGTLVGLEATEDAKIAFEALAAIGVGDE